MNKWHFLSLLGLVFLLTQCGSSSYSRNERYTAMSSQDRESLKNPDTVFGQDLILAGESKKEGGSQGIGVNAYLWRASLDTISFMPLAQVEPFTGVITTEWYCPPQTENERFKMTILILDKVLRADAVRVSVFYETYEDGKGWRTSEIDPQLGEQLEETILARARELKFEVNPR